MELRAYSVPGMVWGLANTLPLWSSQSNSWNNSAFCSGAGVNFSFLQSRQHVTGEMDKVTVLPLATSPNTSKIVISDIDLC